MPVVLRLNPAEGITAPAGPPVPVIVAVNVAPDSATPSPVIVTLATLCHTGKRNQSKQKPYLIFYHSFRKTFPTLFLIYI